MYGVTDLDKFLVCKNCPSFRWVIKKKREREIRAKLLQLNPQKTLSIARNGMIHISGFKWRDGREGEEKAECLGNRKMMND